MTKSAWFKCKKIRHKRQPTAATSALPAHWTQYANSFSSMGCWVSWAYVLQETKEIDREGVCSSFYLYIASSGAPRMCRNLSAEEFNKTERVCNKAWFSKTNDEWQRKDNQCCQEIVRNTTTRWQNQSWNCWSRYLCLLKIISNFAAWKTSILYKLST